MTNENGNYIILCINEYIHYQDDSILQVGLHTQSNIILILYSQMHKAEYIFVNWSPTDHIERASS